MKSDISICVHLRKSAASPLFSAPPHFRGENCSLRGIMPEARPRWHLSDGFGLVLQLFRLVVSNECVENGLQFAVHYIRELVQSEADAVIGHAVLREIVSADLLAAVAAADLRFAFLGQRLLLPFHFLLVEPGTQNAHAFFAVLNLRLF